MWPRQGLPDRLARQESGESTFLLAREGSEVLGRGEIRWSGPFMPEVRAVVGDVPEINGLAVVTDRRGEGIGTGVIAAMEAEARERGVPAIGLGVAVDNVNAARLYRRLGYDGDLRYFDRYTWYDASGDPHDAADPCIFMTKTLSTEAQTDDGM
jgi:ribosomal protein S18 acetylase RimI-like enzyme